MSGARLSVRVRVLSPLPAKTDRLIDCNRLIDGGSPPVGPSAPLLESLLFSLLLLLLFLVLAPYFLVVASISSLEPNTTTKKAVSSLFSIQLNEMALWLLISVTRALVRKLFSSSLFSLLLLSLLLLLLMLLLLLVSVVLLSVMLLRCWWREKRRR